MADRDGERPGRGELMTAHQATPTAGRRRDRMPPRVGSWAASALCHTAALLVAALIGLPFAWMLLTSIKSPLEIRLFPPTWMPWPPHPENYWHVLEVVPFGRYLLNSTIAATGAVALQAITVSTA